VPLHANRSKCLLRQIFTSSGGGHEIAIANDDDPRQSSGGGVIAGSKRRAERRGPQHFAMEHRGTGHVRRVLMCAGDEGARVNLGNRLASDGPVAWWSDRILGWEILREGLAAGELSVGERAAGGGIRNLCVGGLQRVGRDVPFFRCNANEDVARSIGDMAELR